jgi:uncharacterized membrane-anchored protein YitT (DUF2179 family)
VAQNKANIQLFLIDFKSLNRKDFIYSIYIESNGNTFVHLTQYTNVEVQQLLLNVPSFLEFQQQRDISGLVSEPEIEFLELFDSSEEYLD